MTINKQINYMTNMVDPKSRKEIKKIIKKLYFEEYGIFKPLAFLRSECTKGSEKRIKELSEQVLKVIR